MQTVFHATKPTENLLVAGKFLLYLSVSFIAFDFLASLPGLVFFEMLFAIPASFVLGLIGFEPVVQSGEPVLIFLNGFDMPIAITYLCTGILEWVVLSSAIASSTEITAKKRITGIAAGTVGIFFFNTARIIASILMISFLGLSLAGFGHDIFFRIFLFASIAVFYFAWLKKSALEIPK